MTVVPIKTFLHHQLMFNSPWFKGKANRFKQALDISPSTIQLSLSV